LPARRSRSTTRARRTPRARRRSGSIPPARARATRANSRLSYVDDPTARARFGGAWESGGGRAGLFGSTKDPIGFYGGGGGGPNSFKQGVQYTSTPRSTSGRYGDWRYGFLSRPTPWLSFAGVASHINQPNDGSGVLVRDYDVALGARPSRSTARTPTAWARG
jgi:hypothetical protein